MTDERCRVLLADVDKVEVHRNNAGPNQDSIPKVRGDA